MSWMIVSVAILVHIDVMRSASESIVTASVVSLQGAHFCLTALTNSASVVTFSSWFAIFSLWRSDLEERDLFKILEG
jgi:hypothetical protein